MLWDVSEREEDGDYGEWAAERDDGKVCVCAGRWKGEEGGGNVKWRRCIKRQQQQQQQWLRGIRKRRRDRIENQGAHVNTSNNNSLHQECSLHNPRYDPASCPEPLSFLPERLFFNFVGPLVLVH